MCQIWERTYLCGHLVEWVAKCDEKSRNPRRRCKNRSLYRRDSDEKHNCETCTSSEAQKSFSIPDIHRTDEAASGPSASSWRNAANEKPVAAKHNGLRGWLSRTMSKAGKYKMQKAVESLVQRDMTFEMKAKARRQPKTDFEIYCANMSSRFKKDFPFYEHCSIRTEFTTDTTWDEVVKESEAGDKIGYIWDPRRRRYNTEKERRQDLSDADRDNLQELCDLGYTPENYTLGLVAQLGSLSSRRRNLEALRKRGQSIERDRARTSLLDPTRRQQKEYARRNLQRSQTTPQGWRSSGTLRHADDTTRDETQQVMRQSKREPRGPCLSQSSCEAENRLRRGPQLGDIRRTQTAPREADQRRRSHKTVGLPQNGHQEIEAHRLETVREEDHPRRFRQSDDRLTAEPRGAKLAVSQTLLPGDDRTRPACQADATYEPQRAKFHRSKTTTIGARHLKSSPHRDNRINNDPNSAEAPHSQMIPLWHSGSQSLHQHGDDKLRNECQQVQAWRLQNESLADTDTLSSRQIVGNPNDPVPILHTSNTAPWSQSEHLSLNFNRSKTKPLDAFREGKHQTCEAHQNYQSNDVRQGSQATTRGKAGFKTRNSRREAFQSIGRDEQVLRSQTTRDNHDAEAFPQKLVAENNVDSQQRLTTDDFIIDNAPKASKVPYPTITTRPPQEPDTSHEPRSVGEPASNYKVRKLLSSESLAKDVMTYMTYIGSEPEDEVSKDVRNIRTKIRDLEGWRARLENPFVNTQAGTPPPHGVSSQPDTLQSLAYRARRPRVPTLPSQNDTLNQGQQVPMGKWEPYSKEMAVCDRAAQHIAEIRDGRGDLAVMDLEIIQEGIRKKVESSLWNSR